MSIALLYMPGKISAGDAQQDAGHRDEFAHPEIMGVALVRHDVGLIKVVGPDGVERGDVAGHAGHERREQRRQRQTQQPGRTVFLDQ